MIETTAGVEPVLRPALRIRWCRSAAAAWGSMREYTNPTRSESWWSRKKRRIQFRSAGQRSVRLAVEAALKRAPQDALVGRRPDESQRSGERQGFIRNAAFARPQSARFLPEDSLVQADGGHELRAGVFGVGEPMARQRQARMRLRRH